MSRPPLPHHPLHPHAQRVGWDVECSLAWKRVEMAGGDRDTAAARCGAEVALELGRERGAIVDGDNCASGCGGQDLADRGTVRSVERHPGAAEERRIDALARV